MAGLLGALFRAAPGVLAKGMQGRMQGEELRRQREAQAAEAERQRQKDILAESLVRRQQQREDDEFAFRKEEAQRRVTAESMERMLRRDESRAARDQAQRDRIDLENLRSTNQRVEARDRITETARNRAPRPPREDARQRYIAGRVPELTKPQRDPKTSLLAPGLAPADAARKAAEEWDAITGQGTSAAPGGAAGNINLGAEPVDPERAAYERALEKIEALPIPDAEKERRKAIATQRFKERTGTP